MRPAPALPEETASASPPKAELPAVVEPPITPAAPVAAGAEGSPHSILDTVIFGDTASEAGHGMKEAFTEGDCRRLGPAGAQNFC